MNHTRQTSEANGVRKTEQERTENDKSAWMIISICAFVMDSSIREDIKWFSRSNHVEPDFACDTGVET